MFKQIRTAFIYFCVAPCALLMSLAYANNFPNPRADEIYQKFEMSDFADDAEAQKMFAEYQALIHQDDATRQKQLIRLTCWQKPIETSEQLAQAIEYAKTNLILYQTPIPSDIHTDLQTCLGYLQQYNGQVDEALTNFEQALANAYQLENTRLIADIRSIRGSIYSYQGNYSAALEDLITAQHLYESLNITYWANYNLSELAATYRRYGDPETALNYQLKLEKIYLEKKQLLEADTISRQIAFSLEELQQYDDALTRLKQSLKFWKTKKKSSASTVDYTASIADLQSNIANLLIKKNKYHEALNYLKQAEPNVPIEFDGVYGYLHYSFAQVYLALGDITLAEVHNKKALEGHKRGNNNRGIGQALKLASEIEAAKGEFKQAYADLNTYYQHHLEQDKLRISERNAEMQARFDTNKVLNDNAALLQQAKDKEKQLEVMRRNDTLQVIILFLVAIILIIVSVFAYKQMIRKMQFKTLALTDELTGLANRRHTYHEANEFIKQANHKKQPFSVISFDADHFKKVNDNLGHDIGDKVLVKLAALSMSMMRDSDVVGRVGGEEFLVLLPNVSHNNALDIAERLIEKVAHYDWTQINPNLHQTISAGVATLSHNQNLSSLLLDVDKALYSAKASGRNCVKSSESAS